MNTSIPSLPLSPSSLSCALIFPTVFLLAWSPGVLAQEPIAVGPEFRVSGQDNEKLQARPRLDMADDGTFMVAWDDFVDEGAYTVNGRRFSASGVGGIDAQVNTYNPGTQIFPDVAAAPGGEFMVIWQSYDGQDGYGTGVFARAFDSNGNPSGSEISVNSATDGHQHDASLAYGGSDRFLVVWDHDIPGEGEFGIRGQLFQTDGSRFGAELSLAQLDMPRVNDPRVAGGPGGYVVAWDSSDVDGSGLAVQAQLLDSLGTAVGGAFQVNVNTFYDQDDPEVAMGTDGGFVVVWKDQTFPDDPYNGILLRLFASDGTPQTDEILVNVITADSQERPILARTPGDGILVVWDSRTDPMGEFDIVGRHFDSAGNPTTGEFQVNELRDGNQTYADLAVADSRFVVTWTTDMCGLCDRDAKARVFDLSLFVDGFESGDVSAWSTAVP